MTIRRAGVDISQHEIDILKREIEAYRRASGL
jgi:hypothetical protein